MRSVFAWALSSLLAFPSVALSQEDPREQEYTRAAALRASDPEGALAVYRGLHAETAAPRALAQIGLLEGQLGRWLLADQHLTAALRSQGDAWIEARRAVLDTTLAQVRTHVGELTVAVNVPGAMLSVNGAEVGHLPLAQGVRVAVGTVFIDLDAEGHEHLRQPVEVVRGQTRVVVEMVRMRPPPTRAAPPPEAVAAPASIVLALPIREAPRPSITTRWWFWTGLGALVVGGVVAGLAGGGVFNRIEAPVGGTAYNISAIRW